MTIYTETESIVTTDPKDVITVFEAFRDCDLSRLLDAVIEDHCAWSVRLDNISDTCKGFLIKRISKTLDVMRMAYIGSPEVRDHRSQIIVPWQRFVPIPLDKSIERTLGARVVYLDSLDEVYQLLETRSLPLFEAAGCMSEEATCVLIDEPWHEVLARKIWLPKDMCLFDKCSVLADVFWSMTFEGFSEIDDALDLRGAGSSYSEASQSELDEYERTLDEWSDLLNHKNLLYILEAAKYLKNVH